MIGLVGGLCSQSVRLTYDAFIIQKHNNIDIADLLIDSVGTSGGPNGGRCFGAFVADHDGF
jgi:hypothetical protein